MDYFIPSDNACQKCGGFCCKLFKGFMDGGNYIDSEGNDWIEYVFSFLESTKGIQEKALYNVELIHCFSHLIDRDSDDFTYEEDEVLNEEYRVAELNIDTAYCPFHHHETGCVLTNDEKPIACKNFICKSHTDIILHQAMKNIVECEVNEEYLFFNKTIKRFGEYEE